MDIAALGTGYRPRSHPLGRNMQLPNILSGIGQSVQRDIWADAHIFLSERLQV
jgi:hypothetical protein